MDEPRGSLLSVVVDFSPTQWYLSADNQNQHPLTLSTFLSHFLTFLNAHIACKHENTLAVFGAFPGKSVKLYSSTDPAEPSRSIDSNSYPPFSSVNTIIMNCIMDEMKKLENLQIEVPSSIVGALNKALCYINRVTSPLPAGSGKPLDSFGVEILPDPRILVLSVSPDVSTSYIPIMNAIFSAQKLRVTIDICQVYGPDTVFLQQASHLTGGSYIHLERRDALLQYLMVRTAVHYQTFPTVVFLDGFPPITLHS